MSARVPVQTQSGEEASPQRAPREPSLSRRLVALLLVLLGGVVAVGVFTGVSLTQLSRARDQSSLLQAAATETLNLQSDEIDRETGERGFLLTGDTSYLDPYYSGASNAAVTEGELSQLLSGHQGLAADITRVQAAEAGWQQATQPELSARFQGGPDQALQQAAALVATNKSKNAFTALRSRLDSLLSDIGSANQNAVSEVNAAASRLASTLVLGGVVLLALVVMVLVLLRSWVVIPVRTLQNSLRAVASGSLTRRVAVQGPREVSSVAHDAEAMRQRLVDELGRASQLQRELSEANMQLEEAQRIAQVGSWSWRSDSNQVTWSEEVYRIWGQRPSVRVNLASASAAVRPEDVSAVEAAVRRCMEDRHPWSVEQRLQRPDGSLRYLQINGEAVGGPGGELTGLRGTVQDVTDLRMFEWTIAQLDKEIQEQQLEIEAEQRIVNALQQAILPASLPEIPGLNVAAVYLPASPGLNVGGDWWDLLVLPNGLVTVGVGDVAGHGAGAAATMGQLRNATRGLAYAGFEPASVLSVLNRIVSDAGAEVLASLAYGYFDPASRRLVWASAGHPRPIRCDRGTVSPVEGGGGPMLGIDPTAKYGQHELILERGSAILLYSDGLVERPGEELEHGTARLIEEVRASGTCEPQPLCDHLIARMLVGGERRDDVCVLALRATGEVQLRQAGPTGSRVSA